MREGWKTVSLGDVCVIDKTKYKDGEMPYVGMEDIISGKGKFVGSREPKKVGSSTFRFTPEHLLYGRLRPYLNKVLLPDFEGHCSSEIFPLLPKVGLDKSFLFYWITSERVVKEINRTCTGTRMPRANVNEVLKLDISLPTLPEQKRIVAILDEAFAGIDAAIANTEKNLANARELFESYLESVAHDKQPLGKYVNIKTGKLNANAAVEGGEFPFFTCSREIYEIDHYAFDCEAILLAGNNAAGDFNVKHYKGKFNAYQRTYVITINDDKSLSYRFLYFQLLKSLKELKNTSVGAGTKFLKLGMIQNLRISVPAIDKQEEILEKLEFLMGNSKHLESIYQQKLNSLKELKQSLLQKAFSGELTSKPDKLIDEAVA